MAKSTIQLKCFLSHHSFRSSIDWEMIKAYCSSIAPDLKLDLKTEINSSDGLSASEFIEWYEHGFGSGDVVLTDDGPMMIGSIQNKAIFSVAKLSDNKILISHSKVSKNGLKIANKGIVDSFLDAMLRQRLQFCWKTLDLIEKFVPEDGSQVIFHGNGIKGLGIVRNVDIFTGSVILYCYFIYQTKACGYSMAEEGIVNLRDFWFEELVDGPLALSELNGRSCYVRLKNELEKHGKTWNKRLCRIEPLNLQVAKGESYWFISDKMKPEQATEKHHQLSKNRIIAGNYFRNPDDALRMLEKWQEDLRTYLARPEVDF